VEICFCFCYTVAAMVRKRETKNDNELGDVVFDDIDADTNNGSTEMLKKIEKLKKELKACKEERGEYLDGWQRLRADIANKKKDNDSLGETIKKNAQKEIIGNILPVMDSFEMAFSGDSWESVDKNWRSGVEYIFSQLEGVLSQYGVEVFGEPVDEFDPHMHEAVENVETPKEKEDGLVAKVLRKGYVYDGKVLRPAQVKIFKYKN